MSDPRIATFLIASLWSVPFILVHLTGLVLAVARWGRHPRVSLLAALAFALFLVNILLGRGVFYWRWNLADAQNLPRTMQVIGAVNHATNVMSLAAWILLLVALYRWRETA